MCFIFKDVSADGYSLILVVINVFLTRVIEVVALLSGVLLVE